MKMTFQSYSDPGHGWVKVPIRLLEQLGIAGVITPYSYMRSVFAYLEEDVDLTTFVNAYSSRYNCKPVFNCLSSNKTSKIRKYVRYNYDEYTKKYFE